MNVNPNLPAAMAAIAVAASVTISVAAEAGADLFARLDANSDQLLDASEVSAEHRRLFDRLLRRADADADGRLTAAEFAAGLTPSEPPKPIVEEPDDSNPAADALRLLLLKLDVDRDGVPTKREAPPQLADAYDQLAQAVDENENGQLEFRELLQEGRRAYQTAVRIARRQRWDVPAELRRLEAQQGEAAKRFDSRPNPRDALASPRRVRQAFEQFDADGDGRLTTEELPDAVRDRLGSIVSAADRDNSGDTSLAEFQAQARRAARIASLAEGRQAMAAEADQPGMTEGPPQARTSGRQTLRRIRSLDANRDGNLSQDEAEGLLLRRFDRLDANRDGQLDAQELRRAAEIVERQADQPNRQPNRGNRP